MLTPRKAVRPDPWRRAAELERETLALRQQVTIERERARAAERRCQLLESQTRQAFTLATWGGAPRGERTEP